MGEKKNSYIMHPKSVVDLSQEINRAVDNYWNRELAELDLKQLLWEWAGTGKLFKAQDYNKTIKKLVGKRRLEVVDRMLQGYQNKL